MECFLRNPNCSCGKICCWLTKAVNRLAIILSNNFPTMLRRLIGLYELGSVGGLLGLGIGIIVAHFQE